MRNYDVAHNFYYGIMRSFSRSSMTVSYSDNKYWSYGTVIAKITKNIEGKTVCIISDNTFSNTTSKHIGELLKACPFQVIRLPQKMWQGDFNAYDVVKRCIDNIMYYANSKLTQQANRENFKNNYRMLKSTLDLEGFESEVKKITNTLKEYQELFNILNDPDKIIELKAKQRALEKQKQENLKKELNTLLKKYSYMDLIRFTYAGIRLNDYSIEDYNTQKELKSKLEKYFNPKNELSFVWFDDDYCYTSYLIRVDRKEAETFLKLWGKGKLKRGMKISRYIVLDIQKDFIRISCHKIPTKNLQALLNEITISKAA